MVVAFAHLASRQHGLVTRVQLLEMGTSPRQLDRLIARGALTPLRRGVYATAGAPSTWEQALLAACLSAGSSARASHRAAAALWGLAGFAPDLVEITIDPRHRTRQPDLIVHESNRDLPGHRAVKRAIPVTSVPRTLNDLSAFLRPAALGPVVDDAVRRKLTTLPAYRRVARDLAARGRRRSTTTKAIVDARTTDSDLGESAAEARLMRTLIGAGLPRPVSQHRIRVAGRTVRVDLAYPEHGLVIEYDGWAFHGTRSSFDADRARANELELLGLTVLRFTASSTEAEIVRAVGTALARLSAS